MLKKKIIEPYLEKNEEYIGIELEYPLITVNNQVNTKEVVIKLFQYLKEKHGFHDSEIGRDGCIVQVKNGHGDLIGLEYSYDIIEFAMAKELQLNTIAHRFFEYFYIVQNFFLQYGCFLTGMGTNLSYDATCINRIYSPYYIAIYEYTKKYTSYKDPNYFLTNMSSVQTHLDVPMKGFGAHKGENFFLETFNLFNKLAFVRGILFSNSLPNPSSAPSNYQYPTNILCARDFNWLSTEIPNIGCIDKEFKSINELVESISNFEVYIRKEGDNYKAFKSTSISEYFSDTNQVDDVLDSYRFLHNVALNAHSTLEIRDDCIQPLNDTFVTSAFNLGLSRKVEEASEIIEKFFKDNKILHTNSRLRSMAIYDKKIVNDKTMKIFLRDLYELSKSALEMRGYGEERYLYCLQNRIDTLQCPSKYQKNQLAQGVSLNEIIKQCSERKEG